MASLIDRLKFLVSKNAQQTAPQYNRAIYNWLGESIVWNPENDDSYITEGYRKNATSLFADQYHHQGRDNNTISSI
jgi:hypothetical protein